MRFDDARVHDIGQALFGQFFQQHAGDEFLFVGAKVFGLEKRVTLVKRGEIDLQLLDGSGGIDDQLAFTLCAGDELVLGLGVGCDYERM